MLHLDTDGATNPWSWQGKRWKAGRSWLEPYAHPMLEHGAVTDGQSVFLFVRERTTLPVRQAVPETVSRASTAEYRAQVAETRTWPLDFTAVERDPEGRFTVTAGQWGTAPLYLTCSGGALRGSWSLTDVSADADLSRLDDVAVTRALTHRSRYTARTLFDDVQQLTERAKADFDPHSGSLIVSYPEPALHARPRTVRTSADVVEAYERRLDRAVNRRPYVPHESAVELSGGMDSGNVAMTLAASHPAGVLAYALMIGGPAGAQQTRRRAEMLRHCGFPDLQVPASLRLPLDPHGQRARGKPVDPTAEPYHEAVELLLHRARDHGVRTVFTGDGGDELLSLRGHEWAAEGKIPGRHAHCRVLPPWLGPRARQAVDRIDEDLAPRTVVNEATLLGFACRTPQFMAAGLWPVSPLCDPDLICFAEQLPVEWRRNKKLAHDRLARLGLSDDVVHPVMRENFAHLMEEGLRRHGAPALARHLEDSVLVDLGYLDGAQLRAAHQRLADGHQVETAIFPVLSLELGLRALLS